MYYTSLRLKLKKKKNTKTNRLQSQNYTYRYLPLKCSRAGCRAQTRLTHSFPIRTHPPNVTHSSALPVITILNNHFFFRESLLVCLCMRATERRVVRCVMVKETIIIVDRLSLLDRGHYAALNGCHRHWCGCCCFCYTASTNTVGRS